MKKKSNKIWWILLGVLATLVIGMLVAKKMGWINSEKPTEVDFGKVAMANLTETVFIIRALLPAIGCAWLRCGSNRSPIRWTCCAN